MSPMNPYDPPGDINPREAISDPTMRRLVEIAEQRFTGRSGDGAVTAVFRGDLNVASIEVRPDTIPGVAGAGIVEALNDGLTTAREEVRRQVASVPGLAPQLVSWLEGEDEAPKNVDDVKPDQVLREFRGQVGDVVVAFDAREQRFSSAYVAGIGEEDLAAVVKASNRALASAQTGRDGAQPLDEQIQGRLEELDVAMDRIEERLDDVSAKLDEALARFEE